MALMNLGQRLFMNFSRADVIFVLDNQEIPAHRLILAESCPYFDKLLCGHFKESNSKRIKIPATSAKVFMEVMRFIYLGELEISNWNFEDLLTLLSLAHKYQLDQLIDAVTKALEKQALDFDSWELVNSAASIYDSDALKAMCVTFVEMKIQDFLSIKDLEKFTADFIHYMLDAPIVVSCNQDHVLFAICEWKKHHKLAGISLMLSKINWTNVSPAINNLILKNMFSKAQNEEDIRFLEKVVEMMKPQSEVIARVERLTFGGSEVEFDLEKYQCSILCYLRYRLTQCGIYIDFAKGDTGFVEIPVKRIEFESATKFNITRIYGYDLEYQGSDMVASEHTLNNCCFKYSAVFSNPTPVCSMRIVLQRDTKLSEIRLRNIEIC